MSLSLSVKAGIKEQLFAGPQAQAQVQAQVAAAAAHQQQLLQNALQQQQAHLLRQQHAQASVMFSSQGRLSALLHTPTAWPAA